MSGLRLASAVLMLPVLASCQKIVCGPDGYAYQVYDDVAVRIEQDFRDGQRCIKATPTPERGEKL